MSKNFATLRMSWMTDPKYDLGAKSFWRNKARAWLSISIITIRNPSSLATRRPRWHALASAMSASKLAGKNSKMNLKSALLQLQIAPPRPDRPNRPIDALVLILPRMLEGRPTGAISRTRWRQNSNLLSLKGCRIYHVNIVTPQKKVKWGTNNWGCKYVVKDKLN